MDRDDDMIPSSPTNTSLSSSDLDTESTGSFFPDRSTSLGTLMGVTYPRNPPRSIPGTPATAAAGGTSTSLGRATASSTRGAGGNVDPRRRRSRRRGGGRRWWMLCREEEMTQRTSLGDFLQVERRLTSAAGGLGGGDGADAVGEHVAVGAGPLFADGRVIPPRPSVGAAQHQQQQHRRDHGAIGRLPVLLTGICSGG